MDWNALQAELDEVARKREASAVLVDGKRQIRRGPFKAEGRNTRGEDVSTSEVWDDEFITTLAFVDGTPRPELVRGLFLDRKRQHYGTES